jgi:hypothetical protein
MEGGYCSLSLWRVVRGSKLHSYPAIIIMHLYNWYHSDITGIHYVHEYVTVYYRAIPLLSAFPFPIPFCSPFVSLYLLGTLLAVIGSRLPRSQVACKLIFPLPSPCSYTPHSKIPTPRGLPDQNIHSLGQHREPGSQDPAQLQNIGQQVDKVLTIGFGGTYCRIGKCTVLFKRQQSTRYEDGQILDKRTAESWKEGRQNVGKMDGRMLERGTVEC